jgi:uncharacterized protein (TIGR02646 family)
MHRIDRTALPVPNCLAIRPADSRYDDLRGAEKEEIRVALLALQRHRCAYCERRTGEERDDGHIEHFRKQADRRDLDLAWSNMYWSCKDEKTCGKHKDKCDRPSGRLARFDPDDLIDPSEEDPTEFFSFAVDGRVRPRDGLDAPSRRRAEETLRVFQIGDSAYLRRSREDAVKPYVRAINSLRLERPESIVRYVQGEMDEIVSAPFATPIRQYLEGFLP